MKIEVSVDDGGAMYIETPTQQHYITFDIGRDVDELADCKKAVAKIVKRFNKDPSLKRQVTELSVSLQAARNELVNMNTAREVAVRNSSDMMQSQLLLNNRINELTNKLKGNDPRNTTVEILQRALFSMLQAEHFRDGSPAAGSAAWRKVESLSHVAMARKALQDSGIVTAYDLKVPE